MDGAPEKQVRNRPQRLSNGRFAPGVSGNPNGRPPAGRALRDLLREALDEPHMQKGRGRRITKREALVRTLIDLAVDGNLGAAKLIFERLEGKPGQHVENSSARFEDDEALIDFDSPWLYRDPYSGRDHADRAADSEGEGGRPRRPWEQFIQRRTPPEGSTNQDGVQADG